MASSARKNRKLRPSTHNAAGQAPGTVLPGSEDHAGETRALHSTPAGTENFKLQISNLKEKPEVETRNPNFETGTSKLEIRNSAQGTRDELPGKRERSHGKRRKTQVPSPESRIPGPESRIPSRESRIPGPESQVSSPESRVGKAECRAAALRGAVRLLPYQRRWVEDDAQLKIVVKARQIGYSFAATLRAVLECVRRKTTWIFLSKGERQSRLLMEKVQEHIQSCGIVARASESAFFEGTLIKQLETRFANGSVIYGLPANPDTARGYTGNVTLDEFAFHADAEKIYTALFPSITRGFGLEVISTPNGEQGKFYELAKAAGLTEPGLGARGWGLGAGEQPVVDNGGRGSLLSPSPKSLAPSPHSTRPAAFASS